MGSLTGGTSTDGGDVNGFKILVFDEASGAVALHAAPTANPSYPGSPMYQKGIIAAENRVAQQENLALWLVKDGRSPWLWVVPDDVRISHEDGITFLECDRTWVAIRTLGGAGIKLDQGLTEALAATEKLALPRPPGPQHQGASRGLLRARNRAGGKGIARQFRQVQAGRPVG